jgi:predicted nucleic acid-binding protein
MKKIFVDTGAWVALNNKRDKFHNDAVNANKMLLKAGYFYITSDYVLDETYTMLRYDVGYKKSVGFGYDINFLSKEQKISVIHITEILLEKAWDIFVKYSDKDFSFTDCTSFAIMNHMKVTEVFAFDKHFEQYGFIRRNLLY